MKKIIFITLFLFSQIDLYGQNSSVFVELGGQGLGATLNYEFGLKRYEFSDLRVRLGAGGINGKGDAFFSIPLSLNKLVGIGKGYFDFGIGATILRFRKDFNSGCISGYYDVSGNFICDDFSVVEENNNFFLQIENTPSLMGTLNIGYRKIPKRPGITWRANITPLFNGSGIWPWFGGVGVGYVFY
jgi:hypothetical protein